MLQFVYHNLQFRLPILPSLLQILLLPEAVARCFSAEKVFLQIRQNSQENTKKGISAQLFTCEFCEISHNIFFKERFGRLLHQKQSFCFLSHHYLLPFQKQCHTYFLAEYFFGLICRLGARVSSTFRALSQIPIFNPVKHLQWSFFLQKQLIA